jgi:ribosomal protein S14
MQRMRSNGQASKTGRQEESCKIPSSSLRDFLLSRLNLRAVSSDSLILAVESSCDETAAAVLRPPGTILSSLIASQAEDHARFGGVVPEVASRNHLMAVDPLVRRALAEAGVMPRDLGAVAATSGPGLAPALLVGASYAKGFALALGIPYLALNHLEGHLLSPFLGAEEIPPHIALLVSGGHTQLTLVRGAGDYTVLGRTLDDAAGEARAEVDGCAELAAAPASAASQGYMVGSRNDELGRYLVGDVGEVLVYPRALNASERAAVTAYLSAKWGVPAPKQDTPSRLQGMGVRGLVGCRPSAGGPPR